MPSKAATLSLICSAIADGKRDEAVAVARRDYPFAPETTGKRQYGPAESTQVFMRDGFLDRYSGERLVFPAVLRVLSMVLPDEFPFNPNWKTNVTHSSFWEVGATVDHLIPVSRGGADNPSNWVTTSMARNSAKMNWSLAELGWSMHPPGDLRAWDGLLGWFVAYARAHPEVLGSGSVRAWYRAATGALAPEPLS